MHVAVLYGSVRKNRQGIKLARFADKELERRGCTSTLVDPEVHRLPLLEMQYSDYPAGEAPVQLEELAQLYRSVDGFLIVSGEYNHGIPPALKNLLDYFLEEYFSRPAGIVSYSGGRFGGVRAAMQLRMTLAELGMPTIPTTLPVGNVGESFDEEGVPADPRFTERSAQFFDEFSWYMQALKAQRAAGLPY
ncbi:MAG: NADPH-dependent FMN reductase [Candidatus Baltobacteraceae bacterium]